MKVKVNLALIAVVFTLGLVLSNQISAKVIYQADSLYSRIRVEDTGGIRTLWFNNAPQTTMSLSDPTRGALEYTEYFHSAHAFKPGIKKVLVLGLGGGSTPKAFLTRYPEVNVTTVEIDQAVVNVAKNYFYLAESSRHQIIVDDARRFLARSKATYDAIFIDAYLADYYGAYVPFHLATKEFFQIVRTRLSPGGVVAYNVIGQINGWNSASLNAIYKTMASVFGDLYLFPARTIRNVVVVGVAGGLPSPQTLKDNAQKADKAYPKLPIKVSSIISRGYVGRLNVAGAQLLTDDYAPVETLSLFR